MMNRSVGIAVLLAVIALVWILSGSVTTQPTEAPSATDQAATPTQQNKPAFAVQVETIHARPLMKTLTLQGQVEPLRDVVLKAEQPGTVAQLAVRKGERVETGALLVKLDVGDKQARLEQALADQAARAAELEASRSLRQRNLASANQIKVLEADLARARAAVKQIQEELKRTDIRAPFAGIVNELPVELGDYLGEGDAIATLIDDSQVLITAAAPQQHVGVLAIGMAVSADLVGNQQVHGEVRFISAQADAASRTFDIEAIAPRPDFAAPFGKSATLTFETGEELAHKVSTGLLALNAAGELTVKGVDAEQRVVSYVVEIIDSDSGGVWLRGLPDSFQLITQGHGFVAPGQTVEPRFADANGVHVEASRP